ncbi:hypothetical protein AXK11_08030 [Cephaloticoccus primus]|uniref:Cytochrome oxidase subunit I profile domain-containing protein n=1 Tax=Cephaloticoccus primus TaxID=1548207 RepID=A0A139SJB0_9BACT|nr:cbb3-type cytochrome c oxidase subunit I [Cephaloticoccus primus]KXU34668.1 hypothetical protein AXK11_08030 [Cephaloticoccus primus]
MTTFSSPASAEVSEIDRSARWPLAFLIFASLGWLVASGVLALLNTLQILNPAFLADCEWLTFGRLQAIQESAFLYGWAVNAALAVGLWILVRLSAAPLRGGNFVAVGAVFWSLGLLLGLVGIATGHMSSFALFQLPAYIQPLMLAAFAAMAAPGVLAWTGRRERATFASQWYIVAALFLFPWAFSVAQVMLLFAPVRGVLQPIIATWYGQNFLSLFLGPVAVAALYYLLPKIKGQVLPAYDFAPYGFWALLIFSSWMGGRHLIGGPVPVWLPTVAIAAASMALIHHIVIGLNLRSLFAPGASLVLKFAAAGFAAYLLAGLVDAVFSMRGVALITHFTYFEQAQLQLFLAAFSLIIFAAIYYLGPRLLGVAWPSTTLIRAHFLASLIGFPVLVLVLALAGWRQGLELLDAEISLRAIAAHTRPWLQVAAAAQALLLFGNLTLFAHFARLLCAQRSGESLAQFRQPQALEATAS